ncbi:MULTISPECIES: hypothetical protein [Promicromonospora]|jgi:hypothetical protein|uniref:Uncharacterized protein n=1 Tax=Promicromonospora kroppenstedtii TaxID=440482 RepID=A0ABW7XIP4_9MICO|nr:MULTISPECIES: hypothetical protein [Promicromonospora]
MTDADDAQYHSIANPRRTTLVHRSVTDTYGSLHEERETPADDASAG